MVGPFQTECRIKRKAHGERPTRSTMESDHVRFHLSASSCVKTPHFLISPQLMFTCWSHTLTVRVAPVRLPVECQFFCVETRAFRAPRRTCGRMHTARVTSFVSQFFLPVWSVAKVVTSSTFCALRWSVRVSRASRATVYSSEGSFPLWALRKDSTGQLRLPCNERDTIAGKKITKFMKFPCWLVRLSRNELCFYFGLVISQKRLFLSTSLPGRKYRQQHSH